MGQKYSERWNWFTGRIGARFVYSYFGNPANEKTFAALWEAIPDPYIIVGWLEVSMAKDKTLDNYVRGLTCDLIEMAKRDPIWSCLQEMQDTSIHSERAVNAYIKARALANGRTTVAQEDLGEFCRAAGRGRKTTATDMERMLFFTIHANPYKGMEAVIEILLNIGPKVGQTAQTSVRNSRLIPICQMLRTLIGAHPPVDQELYKVPVRDGDKRVSAPLEPPAPVVCAPVSRPEPPAVAMPVPVQAPVSKPTQLQFGKVYDTKSGIWQVMLVGWWNHTLIRGVVITPNELKEEKWTPQGDSCHNPDLNIVVK